ncbi:AraC family transcriptional regulator [Celeribacter indicus]|uniref:Transcriptional regulator n=1 Tax=Celeribacter indicus TaxID=1208324 RepID=A0A0B5E0L7_9RHOB|nr:helix-turn-helix transcriptional regulator [Celeribacter indicus]AJE46012.1 transcriptional regulator [Celeribacter indicus]SDX32826.1 transcriptional regulator, AraC family [Celeribacter indicus]
MLNSVGTEDIIGLGRRYPAGSHLEPHRHDRSQLLYGLTGTVVVTGTAGRWMMPPDSALWIPAQVLHEVDMVGEVHMRSLYLRPDLPLQMPRNCAVLSVSPLPRALLDEIAGGAAEATQKRKMLEKLVLVEIASRPILPLSLPLPEAGPMRDLCQAFSAAPDAHAKLDEWCVALNVSRRTFTRAFRTAIGLSFVEWRTRACVLAAISHLAEGQTVTRIAFDLGYDSSASFTAMFRRSTGSPPSRYRHGPDDPE